MRKDDKYYIQQALDEIELILSYSEGMSLEDLKQQPAILDGIVFRMIQMSEHIALISDGYKKEHEDIEWLQIKGFRNRLVHDYGTVNLRFVYLAISQDIPLLKEKLQKVLD